MRIFPFAFNLAYQMPRQYRSALIDYISKTITNSADPMSLTLNTHFMK